VACVLHARHRAIFADRMRSVGKRLREESGKYPVNENDEEIGRRVNTGTCYLRGMNDACRVNVVRCLRTNHRRHCERSEAIHLTAKRMNGLLRFARNDELSMCVIHTKTKMPGTSPGITSYPSIVSALTTPGSQPSCRARPGLRQGGRSARDRASRRRSRARSRDRTPRRQDRRHARRKCRP
jgi:hypothetical protein